MKPTLLLGSARFLWIKFWILWVSATVFAAMIAGAQIPNFRPNGEDFDAVRFMSFAWNTVANGISSGALRGVAQWLVLRRIIRLSGSWVFSWVIAAAAVSLLNVSLIGLLAVLDVNLEVGEPLNTYRGVFALVSLALLLVVDATILVGLTVWQWLLLRRQVRQAIWWIPISVVAAIASLVGNVANENTILNMNLGVLASAVVDGALTGAGLVFMIIRSDRTSVM